MKMKYTCRYRKQSLQRKWFRTHQNTRIMCSHHVWGASLKAHMYGEKRLPQVYLKQRPPLIFVAPATSWQVERMWGGWASIPCKERDNDPLVEHHTYLAAYVSIGDVFCNGSVHAILHINQRVAMQWTRVARDGHVDEGGHFQPNIAPTLVQARAPARDNWRTYLRPHARVMRFGL